MAKNKAGGGFDWANATVEDIANAAKGARSGMLINFYRTLLPSKWQVYWCNGNDQLGDPDCGGADYTPAKFFCQYGTTPTPLGGYSSNAYIWAGDFTDVNWDLLGKLTGPIASGTNNLNAIWYMMLLGGDLGWDLPQWGQSGAGPYVQTADPQLAFDQIKQGYDYSSTGCAGNGSTTGIQTVIRPFRNGSRSHKKIKGMWRQARRTEYWNRFARSVRTRRPLRRTAI